MSHLEFSEEKFQSRAILGKARTPKMVSFFIKKGIVKSEKTAGNFLIAMSATFFILSIFILGYFVFGIRSPFNVSSSYSPEGIRNVPPEILNDLPLDIKSQIERFKNK